MTKTGLVLKVENSSAILATHTGEFVKVAISGKAPEIGQTYTGNLVIKHNYIRYLAAAVILLMIFVFGGGTYGYCATAETIRVDINPSVELRVNFFGKIIKVRALNSDGKTLLRDLKIYNTDVDDALTTLVKQAKKDNFINKDYILQGKTVAVKISSSSFYKTKQLTKFKSYTNHQKISTIIDNGERDSTNRHKKDNSNNIPNKQDVRKFQSNSNQTSKSTTDKNKKHTNKQNEAADKTKPKSDLSHKSVRDHSKTNTQKQKQITKYNKDSNTSSVTSSKDSKTKIKSSKNANKKHPAKDSANSKRKNSNGAASDKGSKNGNSNGNSSVDTNKTNNSSKEDKNTKANSNKTEDNNNGNGNSDKNDPANNDQNSNNKAHHKK